MYKVIKEVTRIEDKRNDSIVFKDGDGKICYLDCMETYRTGYKVGDTLLAYVVSSKESVDFIRILEKGSDLRNIFLRYLHADGEDFNYYISDLLYSVKKYDIEFNTTYVSDDVTYLVNSKITSASVLDKEDLSAINFILLKMGMVKYEGANEVNKIRTVSELLASIKDKRKLLFSSDEFDTALAKDIFKDERELTLLTSKYLDAFRSIISTIKNGNSYVFKTKKDSNVFKVTCSVDEDTLELLDSDGVTVTFNSHKDKITFVEDTVSISEINTIWTKGCNTPVAGTEIIDDYGFTVRG